MDVAAQATATERVARVDMHCHSSASRESRLGIQRAVGLPECATPPEEVYALAKRRGMDFVTITDHDTIAGVLQIADRADVFVSEELTVHFRGEPQAVHVLCYGIDGADHEWLQAHRDDLEACVDYLRAREITHALAHPFYKVAAPLLPRHRHRLAHLFDVWEVRNGARARELNQPAATYVATRGGVGVGGSDDHAGVDIGRTWTQGPAAASPAEFLAYVRAGRVEARGAQGSAAKWAHAAIALAARAHAGAAPAGGSALDPADVIRMASRLLSEADARHGSLGGDLSPADAIRLLRAWLSAVELDDLDGHELISHMQDEGFSHGELYRRACRAHERKLRLAVDEAVRAAVTGAGLAPAAARVFESCVAAVPYAPASAFLARERAKLDGRREDGEIPRVAIIADGIGATHGVSRAIAEIRQRGVPGFEIEVLGTDAEVDRRLSAVADVEVPHYAGLYVGVPSLTSAVQALAEGSFDVVHVCSPGPAGVAGTLLARAMGLPLVGSYHTELSAYAMLRTGEHALAEAMEWAMRALYGACHLVLSPSPASDSALAALGVAPLRVARWDRGVDTARFDPARRDPLLLPGAFSVLYAGRITREKGAELLAEAFLAARARDPRLHLVLAGGGPEQERVRGRVGEAASFLGWLEGEELARAYASADALLFCSATETFGQVILEAQASGLPVVALAAGGPQALIEHRVSGLLCEPSASSLAQALLELASSPALRERLAMGGLRSARARTWAAALGRLAEGYQRALDMHERDGEARAA